MVLGGNCAMKKKICACLVSGALLLSSSFAFSDLTTEHWAYNVVHQMQAKGIVSGFLDNTFQPESSVTRAQFATMLVKTLNLPIRTEPAFFEDLEDHWAKSYAESVAEFVDGKMVGNRSCFLPEDAAIREEVAMAAVRAKGLENKTYSVATLDDFTDKDLISLEARKYVAIAVENGIMKGNADKTFNPKGQITRAEITALMSNLLKMEVTQTPRVDTVTPITENAYVTFREKYINNYKKYAEVKFTKINDTSFEMYLVGYNEENGVFGINQPIAVDGNEGFYSENGSNKLKIVFNKNVVKISALDQNYDIFAGEYQRGVNVSTIDGLVESQWNGTYSVGQKPDVSSSDPAFSSVIYKVVGFTEMGDGLIRFMASSIINGAVTSHSATGTLNGSKVVYNTGNGVIEFFITEDGALEVTVTDMKYKDLAGIYLRRNGTDKFTQYKEMAEGTILPYGTTQM